MLYLVSPGGVFMVDAGGEKFVICNFARILRHPLYESMPILSYREYFGILAQNQMLVMDLILVIKVSFTFIQRLELH